MSDRETFDAFADALQQRRRLAQSSALSLATRARLSAAADAPSVADELWAEASALVQRTLRDLYAAEEALYRQNEALFDARVEMDAQGYHYRQLFELAPAGYLVTDAAGTILEVNQEGVALFNRPRNSLIGTPLATFVAEQERSAFRAALGRMQGSREVEEWPVRMVPTARQAIEVVATVRTVRDPRGAIQALYWLLRDETARHPDDIL